MSAAPPLQAARVSAARLRRGVRRVEPVLTSVSIESFQGAMAVSKAHQQTQT
jgi:hypothetical protein